MLCVGLMAERRHGYPEKGTDSIRKAMARNEEEVSPTLESSAELRQIFLHLLCVLIT